MFKKVDGSANERIRQRKTKKTSPKQFIQFARKINKAESKKINMKKKN